MTKASSTRVANWREIALVLIAALGLRLGWGLTRATDEASLGALPDQQEYVSLARNLRQGLGLQFLDSRFNDTVRAFRTPGYPLLIAACGGNVRSVRVVQAVLDTSTVLAIFLLSRLLMGGRSGPLAAAIVVALNPYLIYFAGLVLSETLFAAMLAWGMLLMAYGSRGDARRGSLGWFCGAVLLAVSVLVRPSAVALTVLLGLLSVFLNRCGEPSYQSGGFARRMPPGLAMVLLTLVCLLPWAVRNRIVLGDWIWLDTNSGFTLYDGYNPDATGESNQTFINRLPELQALDEVQRNEYLSQGAWEYVRAHPGRVWNLFWAKLGRTWSPAPLSRQYGTPALRWIALTYSVPFDALVLVGLVWGRFRKWVKVFVIAPAVYFSIIHGLTVGSIRYRIPAEPPLAVLIAGLAASGATLWRRSQLDGSAAHSADNSY